MNSDIIERLLDIAFVVIILTMLFRFRRLEHEQRMERQETYLRERDLQLQILSGQRILAETELKKFEVQR